MKKILSWVMGAGLGLFIVAPAFDYKIPLMVNSFFWCYLVVASGLFGMLVLSFDIHPALKSLSVYLFASCFISQAPYASFNAYLLVVVAFYFFILAKKCDFAPILNFIQAAFWLEFILAMMQLIGKDTLINFNKPTPVMLGTVMQYMRFASVLAIMTPFLMAKNKLYVFPITIMCVFSESLSFAISLMAGAVSYVMLDSPKKIRVAALALCVLGIVIYSAYDWGSIRGAVIPSNGGRVISWINILQTWVMDTSRDSTFPMLEGPVKWVWVLFGHGMDTFLPLFPIYKHDLNPFPQAHNCWLQFGWEIGIIGLGIIAFYCFWLIYRLMKKGEYGLVSGAFIIGTNMFFAFPTRMTQTALLIVAYAAFCEKKLKTEIKL